MAWPMYLSIQNFNSLKGYPKTWKDREEMKEELD